MKSNTNLISKLSNFSVDQGQKKTQTEEEKSNYRRLIYIVKESFEFINHNSIVRLLRETDDKDAIETLYFCKINRDII